MVERLKRGEQPPQVPVSDGVENMKILMALHRSLENGLVEKV
jgi:hypothetical protein